MIVTIIVNTIIAIANIVTTIISISCFALVVFVIYKGIGYAKKVNGVEEPKVVIKEVAMELPKKKKKKSSK